MTDVTVIIPVHEDDPREEWLKQALASFPKDTPYLIAKNTGDVGGSMTDALEQVDTEWVLPFGSDDVATEGFLESMVDHAWNADVVYPECLLVNEDLQVDRDSGVMEAQPFCGNRLQVWNYVPGAALMRTAAVREVGGWRDMPFEDWDLFVRLFRAGYRFKPCPAATMLYRRHDGSRERTVGAAIPRWQMKQMVVGDREPTGATFYYQATPATTYWRCQVPARALPAVATNDLLGFGAPGGGLEFPDHEGAAVFQFPASHDRAGSLLALREAGHRVLVEVDDNYLDESDSMVRRRAGWTLKVNEGSPHSVEGHRFCVKNADGVIASTPLLADIYSEHTDSVFVCPNSIDPADWNYDWRDELHGESGFVIGWFASLSHDVDADLVKRGLKWASGRPGVTVVTMGYSPAWNFNRIALPWRDDLTSYFKQMHVLDVGVCPIRDSEWARCRSDLKALEYGMAGALPIVQRAEPYMTLKDAPGLLWAGSQKEFYHQIRWCVENQGEVRERAELFRAWVLENRTIDSTVHLWREAISG